MARRQRPSYAEAAQLLARVKRVLGDGGRHREWDEGIAGLLRQHRTLRALRDELDALGLG
jgi:uncharacterized Zn finger protein